MSKKSNQVDVFTLFSESVPKELLDKVEDEKKKKEEEKKKKEKILSKKDKPKYEPDNEKKQIELPVNVYYAREKITITEESFAEAKDSIKDGKVSKEDIRIILENSFPELSKDRTFMDYDKGKSILVPVLTGGRTKGVGYEN